MDELGGHSGGQHQELHRTPRRPGDCCDTELKLVLIACGGCCGGTLSQPSIRGITVFQAANDRR